MFSQVYGFNVTSNADYTVKKQNDETMVNRDLTNIGQSGTMQLTAGLYSFLSQQPNQNNPETDIFYYHSDHLGSTSYLTNASGMPSQHVEYLPFGETLAQENTNSWQTTYKFNGKELDEETGLYYYGARYYDPRTSVWLGVDLLAHKNPNESPYAYCKNNPIILADPDGKNADWFRNDNTGSVLWNPSTANSVSLDNGDQYRNIGPTYSTYSFGSRVDYNQNDFSNASDASPRFNLEGGQYIPHTITTDDGTKVAVSFNYNSSTGGNGDKAISKDAVSLVISGVNEANNGGAGVKSIDVSTTTTGKHSSSNSLHYTGNGARAVDIDAVNGMSVSKNNSHNKVDAIQEGMKHNPNLNENYGPNIQERNRKTHPVSGHNNHIHVSTNPENQ